MKRTNITLPEVEKMYDATLLERHGCQAYTVDNNVEGSSLPLTLV